MKNFNPFDIKSDNDFESLCIEVFNYQYQNVKIYREFVDFLKINPKNVTEYKKIPFLPIEFFKKYPILSREKKTDFFFQSSGTTQTQVFSKHYIGDLEIYQKSIIKSFENFIGKPEDYIFLGLLPNYLEKKNSSLIYMVDFLMKKSAKKGNGYFLYNHQELLNVMNSNSSKKIILFGVSFALLDFLDTLVLNGETVQKNENLIVIETGGMKGRKEEMTKLELLKILKKGLGTEWVFSEYSMTELLSQAYSLGENWYQTPLWMRVLVRDTDDPFSYQEEGRLGGVNIIDLANIYSCSFIETKDLGRLKGGFFQVEGRMDHSDIRGCSLLVS